jgi:hypothetical protein
MFGGIRCEAKYWLKIKHCAEDANNILDVVGIQNSNRSETEGNIYIGFSGPHKRYFIKWMSREWPM